MRESQWDPRSMSVIDLSGGSDQAMIDGFYDLCDHSLQAARVGSLRARQILAAAERLVVWFPDWLKADLEVEAFLERLTVAVESMLSFGTDQPAA